MEYDLFFLTTEQMTTNNEMFPVQQQWRMTNDMKGLSVVIVGGGAGLGALLAEMAVAEGAAALGIIDIDADAAEAALDGWVGVADHRRVEAEQRDDDHVGQDFVRSFDWLCSTP